MCGIVGAVNWGDGESLLRMNEVQTHRGPDDDGLWQGRATDGRWIGLGSRRLAILDLSPAGHMPMTSEDGSLVIVYNGEVYNFAELRTELEAKGHRFRSHTDTEVILRLYQEEGPAAVTRLNGMFALAIWDERRQELFLARDHFGVKPLYYVQQGDRFAFASEIKSLLELPGFPREVDAEALHQYLTFLWVPDPRTMLRGVLKLPAGHYAIIRAGRARVERYWDLQLPPADHRFPLSEAECVEQVRERFRRSVVSQMVSDVPIGAFLSSGLDSSSIVAMMSQASSGPVRTYTIAFPPSYRTGGLVLDDTNVARLVADRFGCRHTEILVEPDVADLLPRVVWHLDEPIADPAAIMAYLICREARKEVTVLLSGVGGDELFAGYRKHQAHFLAERYQRIPGAFRKGILEPVVNAFPSMRGTSLATKVRLAKKMVRSGSLPAEDRFLMDSTYLTEEQKAGLYSRAQQDRARGLDPWSQHRAHFRETEGADFLNRMLYLDTKAFMVSLNLTYNDKMSMAASVEGRVPFLDKDLATWVAWNVPPGMKLRDGTTKWVFRKAMEGVLPDEVFRVPKAGFGAPIDFWLAGQLRPMVEDLLSPETVRRRGYFDPAFVQSMLADQRTGRRDWSSQLWQLLSLELWMQAFVDESGTALGTQSLVGATLS